MDEFAFRRELDNDGEQHGHIITPWVPCRLPQLTEQGGVVVSNGSLSQGVLVVAKQVSQQPCQRPWVRVLKRDSRWGRGYLRWGQAALA